MGTVLDFEVASRYPKQSQQKMKRLLKTVMPVMKQLRQSLYADEFLFPAGFQEYYLGLTEEARQIGEGSAVALLNSIREDKKRECETFPERADTLVFGREIQENIAEQDRAGQGRVQNKNKWKQWNKVRRYASQIQRPAVFKRCTGIEVKRFGDTERLSEIENAAKNSGAAQMGEAHQKAEKRKGIGTTLKNLDRAEFLAGSRQTMPKSRFTAREQAYEGKYFFECSKEILETAERRLFQKIGVPGKTGSIAAESVSTEAILWKKGSASSSAVKLENSIAKLKNAAAQGMTGFGTEDAEMKKAGSTASKRRIAVELENTGLNTKNRKLTPIKQYDRGKPEIATGMISTGNRTKIWSNDRGKPKTVIGALLAMDRAKIWSKAGKSPIAIEVPPTMDRVKKLQNAKKAELILSSVQFARGMKLNMKTAADIKWLYTANKKGGQIQKTELYAEKKNGIRSAEWLVPSEPKRQAEITGENIGKGKQKVKADENLNNTYHGLFGNMERMRKINQGFPMKTIRDARTKFYTETKANFDSVGRQRSFVMGLHNIDLKADGMARLDQDTPFFPDFDFAVQDKWQHQERYDAKRKKDSRYHALQSSLEEMKRMLLERIQEKENIWTMEEDALLTMSPFGFRDGF